MKEIVSISQFVLAQIFNNGKHWYCFLSNQKRFVRVETKSLYGHMSHVHYVSDSFGILLEDLIKGFSCICPHFKVI